MRYAVVDIETGDIQFFPERKPGKKPSTVQESRGELNLKDGFCSSIDPAKSSKEFSFHLSGHAVGNNGEDTAELAAFSETHYAAWKEIFEGINSKPDPSTPSQSMIQSFRSCSEETYHVIS